MNLRIYILLIWITNGYSSITQGSEFTPEFKVIPLGSSSFLITWKSNFNDSDIFYEFHYQEVRGVDLGPELMAGRIARATDNQVKLNDLKENTRYRIKMVDKNNYRSYNMMEARTGKVDFSIPFKPDFKYSLYESEIYGTQIKITWLPCGKQEDCGDEKTGSSFYVKYRMKGESTFHQKKEYYDDYVYVNYLPGETYEIIVGSTNLPFDTESDAQEIFIPSRKKQSK